MSLKRGADELPSPWADALDELDGAHISPSITCERISAPSRLATFSAAFSADVVDHHSDVIGTGRIVFLYEPEGNESWGGSLRVICFAKAPLEADLGLDPFLSDVAWSWLLDALGDADAVFDRPAGTATKTINTGYGEIASTAEGTEMEVRASWSPRDFHLRPHLEGWLSFVLQLSGIPPLPEGVAPLDLQRRFTRTPGHD